MLGEMSAFRTIAFAVGLVALPAVAQRPDPPPPAPPGEVRPVEAPVPPRDIRDIVELTPSMKRELTRLRLKAEAWATQQVVIDAAAESARRRLPDCPENRWRTLGELDQQVRPFVRSDAADELRRRMSGLEGALLFADLRDARGLPVAATSKPFLYDASRRELFVRASTRTPVVGDPERNLVTKKYWVSICVPVMSYAVRNGRLVPEKDRTLLGVLEIGVDMRHLARHVIGER